jgi:hypothetical protein
MAPLSARAAKPREASLRPFVVLWTHREAPPAGRRRIAFEGDVAASTPREAREAFAALFPADRIKAVKLRRGNGRFV